MGNLKRFQVGAPEALWLKSLRGSLVSAPDPHHVALTQCCLKGCSVTSLMFVQEGKRTCWSHPRHATVLLDNTPQFHMMFISSSLKQCSRVKSVCLCVCALSCLPLNHSCDLQNVIYTEWNWTITCLCFLRYLIFTSQSTTFIKTLVSKWDQT